MPADRTNDNWLECFANSKADPLGNGLPGGTADQRSSLCQFDSIRISEGAGEVTCKVKGAFASEAKGQADNQEVNDGEYLDCSL